MQGSRPLAQTKNYRQYYHSFGESKSIMTFSYKLLNDVLWTRKLTWKLFRKETGKQNTNYLWTRLPTLGERPKLNVDILEP